MSPFMAKGTADVIGVSVFRWEIIYVIQVGPVLIIRILKRWKRGTDG